MPKVTKRLLQTNPQTLKKEELARFWMEGDEVKAQWSSDSWRKQIERSGIAVAEGVFFPQDGEPFFRNLELTFSYSTFVSVVGYEVRS
jgi:hypothetical protein